MFEWVKERADKNYDIYSLIPSTDVFPIDFIGDTGVSGEIIHVAVFSVDYGKRFNSDVKISGHAPLSGNLDKETRREMLFWADMFNFDKCKYVEPSLEKNIVNILCEIEKTKHGKYERAVNKTIESVKGFLSQVFVYDAIYNSKRENYVKEFAKELSEYAKEEPGSLP